MKRIILSFSILIAAGLFVLSCKKDTPTPAPPPDTETSKAIDIAWATYVITDVEQMGAFSGENLVSNHFYVETPWSAKDFSSCACGTVTAFRDTLARSLNMGFNKTYCVDDYFREGTEFIDYNYNNPLGVPLYLSKYLGINQDPHARYYHDYGFCGLLTLSAFKVNGWNVKTGNVNEPLGAQGEPVPVFCTLESSRYDATVTKLTWRFGRTEGSTFSFESPTFDTVIIWKGTFVKTLLNSTDKKIWNPTSNHLNEAPLTWSLGLVSYSGAATGSINYHANPTITAVNPNPNSFEPFAITFGDPSVNPAEKSKPLIRDFTCSSDPIYGVSQGSVLTTTPIIGNVSRHHPFVRGIMSYTPGVGTADQRYPRKIYFGDELMHQGDDNGKLNDWDPNMMVANTSTLAGDRAPCDNTGEILIKGITYRIDFRK
jgi:hypothetical protein